MGWGNIYKRRMKVFTLTFLIYLDYKALQQREKLSRRSKRDGLWEKAHERNAKRVLKLIVELEGLWVKMGQYLSTRADVLPEAYIRLLRQLQDSLPPRDLEEVRSTIEKQLGKSMDDLFKSFVSVPLATASIAQVHRATLHDGQEVVVKVQHKGIKTIILEDLKNAKSIVDWIAWAEPQYDFNPMIDEWIREAPKELDFDHEAENTRKVSRNLGCKSEGLDKKPEHVEVLIPKVIQSTEKVLILEYMDGVRLSDSRALEELGVDKQKLVEEITRAYAHQIYVDGFFNGDPHPGNFLVSREPPHRPILLDFGLTKLLSSSVKHALAKMFLAAAEGDHVALLSAFAEMGLKLRLDMTEQAMEITNVFFRATTPATEALVSGSGCLAVVCLAGSTICHVLIVKMDKAAASSSHDLAQRLYDKNIELDTKRRKSAQARVPSDPNAWQQMRENFETIILEDHSFSEKHNIEFALWQLHYRRIEEFRAHYSAASATVSTTSQTRGGPARPDRASKIRLQFKTFLSEATGFYHDLILKIRAKYGLPIGQFYPEQENHNARQKDGKKFIEIKKGLISCHRCLIYLGDLARYKGLYGEGESKSRDYAAASSYYLQAASLWPSSGNPHHQLAILATYSGDELMAVYRYFRSLAAEHPFSTARDNLIVAFEKNRQSYSQLHVGSNDPVKESSVRAKGRGRGKTDSVARSKEPITETDPVRQLFKAFRVRFVRLNGILFTHTSLETFEEILSLVINGFQELLSSGSEEELSFGTDADENGLFIVIIASILIFTVNNVKGGTEGQSYADIVQNTVLLKNALSTFYEIMGHLLKICIQLADPVSSYLLPGILVCVEWIACNFDVISNETAEKRSAAQVKFWSYCLSLFNKLLSAGLVSYTDDEDMSCFTDMTRYEEGVNEYQPALWEDYELRGFLPLEPAHTFLDFSRKHSDSKKDKVARVKRILSAGKVIADRITIDDKKVRFDSKLKKFVVGVETQKDMSSDATTMIAKPLKIETHVEGEEEDEVIVFRPNLIDNRTEVQSLIGTQQERFENVQTNDAGTCQSAAPHVSVPVSMAQSNFHQLDAMYTSSPSLLPVNNYSHSIVQPVNNNYTQSTGQPYQYQSPMWSGNRQAVVSVAGGLQGLSLLENGHMGQPEMHREMKISNATGVRESGMTYTGPSQSKGRPSVSDREPVIRTNSIALSEPDSYMVGRNTSLTMPTSSLKVPTNRPIRHLGPPPGFSSVRPKQVNEPSSALGQNPLNDDYSWLDGYQLQSSMRGGVQPINLPSNLSSQYINDSVATSSFPFPGKQVSTGRFEGKNQKNLEISHTRHDLLQQQYVPQMDQQGQPVWKGNHFV